MMTFISSLFHQTVQVAAYSSETDGDATYATAVEYSCRIDYITKRILTATGEQITSTATIYLNGTQVHPRDKIILPDGTEHTCQAVNNLYDGNGVFSHSEVMI